VHSVGASGRARCVVLHKREGEDGVGCQDREPLLCRSAQQARVLPSWQRSLNGAMVHMLRRPAAGVSCWCKRPSAPRRAGPTVHVV
jgi:hypothetical protein